MSESKSAVDAVSSGFSAISQARRGFTAGVYATVIMSVALLLGKALGGSLLPEVVPMAVMEGVLGSGVGMGILLLATVVGHLVYGGFWGGALAALMPPISETRGVMLGVFLWLIEQLIVVPALGWGIFGTAMAPTIAASPFVFAGTSFLFHLVYGETYGMLLAKEVV